MDGVNVKSDKLYSYKDYIARRREMTSSTGPSSSSSAPVDVKREAPALGKWAISELPAIGVKKQRISPDPPAPGPLMIKEGKQEINQPERTPAAVMTKYPDARIAYSEDHWHLFVRDGPAMPWKCQGDPICEDEEIGYHKHDAEASGKKTGLPIVKAYRTKSLVPTHEHDLLTVEAAARRDGQTTEDFISVLEEYSTEDEESD